MTVRGRCGHVKVTLKGKAAAEVMIVGGGIAGLTAAYELGKAGYGCTSLEARSRTGGRNFTVRGGDSTIDTYGNQQTAHFSDGQLQPVGGMPVGRPRRTGLRTARPGRRTRLLRR
ncbi:FAD-dependent oxidoreductase [Streptomyces sp. NBC_00057]|uniref:FAD-dependent oxidoreductase n=1 Tax=Streptomyces sp. NBC_00057 TaxID=2975634 RepID=UPI0038649583